MPGILIKSPALGIDQQDRLVTSCTCQDQIVT